MAEKSRLQLVADNVFDRVKEVKQSRPDADIPFGQERIGKKTALTRLKKMSPQARKQLIDKVGLDAVLKIIERNDAT